MSEMKFPIVVYKTMEKLETAADEFLSRHFGIEASSVGRTEYFDLHSRDLLFFFCVTLLCPIVWNSLARLEYHYKAIRTLFCGNRYLGCYALALWIFGFSAYRDYL